MWEQWKSSLAVIFLGVLPAMAQAQQPLAGQQAAAVAEPEAPRVVLQAETTASALRLMKFSGALRDRAGNPRSGAAGLTFALYKDQQGGSPLWLEVHNAQLDEQGRYTVLLGSTKSEGLPLELFSSGEARWLGVQLNLPDEEEQPRVLLVSVPYALKAADAETLGGKPPSAFLLADPVGADLRGRPEAGKEAVKEGPPREGVVGPINGEGTVDSLAKFTGANAIGNAGIVEVSGKVGIGTAAPNVKLSLGTDIAAQKLALYDGLGDFYGLGVQPGRVVLHTANSERMAITSAGNVGIGTAAPGARLAVTGAGTGDARFGDPGCGGNYTGIWLNQLTADCSNYNLTSSPGDQTLYVNRPAGAGIEFREGNAAQMVVKAGGKVGIGTTSPNVKLSLGTDITAQKLALYDGLGDFYGLGVQGGRIVVHTANTEKMAITTAGNVGIGTTAPSQKLEVNGNVKISGGGNGIIFPDATVQTTAGGGGTATDLNCVGCVAVSELAFDPATQTELDTEAAARATADAALQNDINGRVSKASDTMAGTLNLPANGLTVGTNQLVASGGNVGIGTATPSSILSLGGEVDRTFGMERRTVADSPGRNLFIRAGGATVGTTNGFGGVLVLSGGISTGAGSSDIQFQTATPGGSGTADHLSTTKMTIFGNGNVSITGNLSVGGTLSKGGGSFRIDHPLDPAHKYLSHSFVESPDMMNVYNGNVRLDENGEAWVELPEWLEALNRDFRYQLTALGAPGPGLYIAEEVSGNRFKIAGGRAGGRVSWQVTGIRQDAYAQAHRIPVEEEKAADHRGFYLHPEAFGQPAEMGIAAGQREAINRSKPGVQRRANVSLKGNVSNSRRQPARW